MSSGELKMQIMENATDVHATISKTGTIITTTLYRSHRKKKANCSCHTKIVQFL